MATDRREQTITAWKKVSECPPPKDRYFIAKTLVGGAIFYKIMYWDEEWGLGWLSHYTTSCGCVGSLFDLTGEMLEWTEIPE